MRFVWPLSVACALLISTPARSADLAFPATPQGAHAFAYFAAFNAGEEAMRAFWTTHGSTKALAQRPVGARLGVYRNMRDEFGALTPVRIGASDAEGIEVHVRTEHGPAIRIRFQCEAEDPFGVIALRVEDEGGGEDGRGAPPPEPAGPPPGDDAIVASLGGELDSLAKAGAFSGVALLDKDGATLFGRAYGLASRTAHTPNRLDTRFNLASINKIFTHVAILQLAEAGKLSLDDTVDRFLGDYPREAAKKITIRMLLDHRGGVPDVLEHPRLAESPASVRSAADWYALVKGLPLDFEPGTRERYSNGGFVLLGEIVARVSGEDYYDYVRKHVYAPAGMTRSDHYAEDEKVEGRATPYTSDESSSRAKADPRAGAHVAGLPGRGSAAGGGYSTAGDLVRFARALRAGKLLDLSKGEGPIGAAPAFGIAGGSPGVNGLLVLEGPYTLVVLANTDPPAAERFARTVGRMPARASAGGARREAGAH